MKHARPLLIYGTNQLFVPKVSSANTTLRVTGFGKFGLKTCFGGWGFVKKLKFGEAKPRRISIFFAINTPTLQVSRVLERKNLKIGGVLEKN